MTQPQSHQPQENPQRKLRLVKPLSNPRKAAADDLWQSLAALDQTFAGAAQLTDEEFAKTIENLNPDDQADR